MTAVCLTACESPQRAELGSHEHRVFGDANFVTVERVGDLDHAAPFAEQYCAQYGKEAHLKGTKLHRLTRYASTVDVTFNCVTHS